jgi:hypothetical protein
MDPRWQKWIVGIVSRQRDRATITTAAGHPLAVFAAVTAVRKTPEAEAWLYACGA